MLKKSIGRKNTTSFFELILPYLFSEDAFIAAERDCSAFLKSTEIRRDDYVLDAFCGVGRHSLALAKKGFTVSAIDICEEYIKYGKRRSISAGLNVDFHCASVLEFEPLQKAGLALCLWNSFGHLSGYTEDKEFLLKMSSVLRPNGHLIIQVNTVRNVERHIVDEVTKTKANVTVHKSIKFDKATSELKSLWTINDAKGRGVSHEFKQRVYEDVELAEELERAGFKYISISADLRGSPYSYDDKMTVFHART